MVRINKIVVMRYSMAQGLAKSSLSDRFTWGNPLAEQEGVVARRAMFAHPYREQDLDAVLEGIAQNPLVEVLDAVPANWRYQIL
jgi:hypothetical protein